MKKHLLKQKPLLIKRLLAVLLCFAGVHYGWSQTRQVTGTVVDENNIPVAGAYVLIKDTTLGTVTDVDGNYSLEISDPGQTLVFSFIGLEKKEVVIGEQTVINVTLLESLSALNEIVVVGYGFQKKENLTGAISSIKIDDLVSQPVSNPSQLLYGRVSGVQLEQANGAPGAAPEITIRGPNIGSSTPLIVVDGIIIESFNEISPSDIESFTVLKDASSAAIYGAQGANGVVLIKTKSGKSGKVRINFNSSVGQARPIALPELLRGADYARAMNEREFNQNGGDPLYSNDIIEQIENGTANPEYFGNDDWFDELFTSALVTDNYLSASGGGENVNYFFSMRHNHQEGTLNGPSSIDIYNIRAKVEVNTNDRLTLGINMVGNYQESDNAVNLGGDGALFRSLMQQNPLQPIRYSNGDYSGAFSFDGINPVPSRNQAFLARIGERRNDDFRLNTQVYGKIKLSEQFNFESTFTHRFASTFVRNFSPTWELFDGPGRETVLTDRDVNSLFQNGGYTNAFQTDNILRYTNTFAEKHAFTALVGHQLIVDNFFNDLFGISVQDFANNNLRGLSNGNAGTLVLSGNNAGGAPTEFTLQSFFSRLEYRFNDKYLVEVNFRADGSSKFPPGEKYGYFPAFSLGWRISEESFMDNIRDKVNSLKLRGGWGRLGSLQNLSLYPYQEILNVGQDYIFGNDDGNLTEGVSPGRIANPDIIWETTETTGIGLDATLFGSLDVSIDWYRRNTNDIILPLGDVPAIVGDRRAPEVNAGDVRNQGWEFLANYRRRVNEDFDFNVGFNFTYNKNELVSLPTSETGETILNEFSINREGSPLQSYYGLVFDGIYQTQEEVDNGPTPLQGGTGPGFRKFRDISGPEGVPDGVIDLTHDRMIIGNSFPDIVYGFNLGANFKGFDINLVFSGVAGVDRLRPQNGNDPEQGNVLSSWRDRWSPENTSSEFPVLGSGRSFSTWDIVDGSYLRMRVGELGYTLPNKTTSKFGVDRMRLYVSGTNLLTFTNFVDGFDPEKAGTDRRNESYPQNKMLIFGMNISL